MKPGLSIIMSVYRFTDAFFLREAIQSMLDQTLRDFEFIIILDGQTPPAVSEVLRRSSTLDSRIILSRNDQCRGPAFSANKGLSMSRSEIIARMDDDEISLPQRLERQYGSITAHPYDIVFSNFYYMSDSGTSLEPAYPSAFLDRLSRLLSDSRALCRHLVSDNFIAQPTVMFKKRAILGLNGYRSNLLGSEDYDLWLRSSLAGLRFGLLEEPLMRIRVPGREAPRRRIMKQKNYAQWNNVILEDLRDSLLSLYPSRVERLRFLLLLIALRSYNAIVHGLPEGLIIPLLSMRDRLKGYRRR